MNRPFIQNQTHAGTSIQFDAGLRRHMLGIYNNMGVGLVITGLVAAFVAGNLFQLLLTFFGQREEG